MCLKNAHLIPNIPKRIVWKLVAKDNKGNFVSPFTFKKWQNDTMYTLSLPMWTDIVLETAARGICASIGYVGVHTFTEKRPDSESIIDMIKVFHYGVWYDDSFGTPVYKSYELGIAQCELQGDEIFVGIDEMGNPGYASRGVRILPETYETLFTDFHIKNN